MLATICDDIGNMLNMQDITQLGKDGIIHTPLAVSLKKIKGATHMVEGVHHLS